MHHHTPAPSFRPMPPMTYRRQGSHGSFSENVFITTDCDRQHAVHHATTFSPDADLIFQMSPIRSHESAASSPPPSPLLYPFPCPSNAHGCVTQLQEHTDEPFQNNYALVQPASTPSDADAPHSLAASLFDAPSPPPRRGTPKNSSPPKTSPRLHASAATSPIPIPRTTSRPSEPRLVVRPPAPLLILSSLDDPYISPSRFSRKMASPIPLRRIEGFDDDSDSCSSTVYSSAGSGPFRLSKLLHDSPC